MAELHTAAELQEESLKQISIVGAGQSASAEDIVLAETCYDSLYARLRRDGHAPFPKEQVPDWAFVPLAKVLGGEMLDAFGFTGERRERLDNTAKEAKRELQKGSASKRAPASPRGRFF